jgi:hypothetical protein
MQRHRALHYTRGHGNAWQVQRRRTLKPNTPTPLPALRPDHVPWSPFSRVLMAHPAAFFCLQQFCFLQPWDAVTPCHTPGYVTCLGPPPPASRPQAAVQNPPPVRLPDGPCCSQHYVDTCRSAPCRCLPCHCANPATPGAGGDASTPSTHACQHLCLLSSGQQRICSSGCTCAVAVLPRSCVNQHVCVETAGQCALQPGLPHGIALLSQAQGVCFMQQGGGPRINGWACSDRSCQAEPAVLALVSTPSPRRCSSSQTYSTSSEHKPPHSHHTPHSSGGARLYHHPLQPCSRQSTAAKQ